MSKPIVGICGSHSQIDGVISEGVRRRYCNAVKEGAGCIPVIAPVITHEREDLRQVLAQMDGILLSGSQSNISAEWYGAEQLQSAAQLDLERDKTALPLIREAIEIGVPLLGICRGMQEMNVAFGGNLHQDLDLVRGAINHREDEALPRDLQYLPAHRIAIAGKTLKALVGDESVEVNSLHRQGLQMLGFRVRVEAMAPDGLIEAITIKGASTFALGVQWHPEWYFGTDRVSAALFHAFGEACSVRHRSRCFIDLSLAKTSSQ